MSHISVLLGEAVAALDLHPDGVYLDATFGRGGHSRAILARLGQGGRLIAMDRDPVAVTAAAALQDARFSIVHAPFSELGEAMREQGIERLDGVLFDLGVSSPQLDEAERGFSFRFDAPLDMRMDTSRGMTAADWLNTASEEEIAHVVWDYGEERFARKVARTLVQARTESPIATTRQLATLVAGAVRTRERGQDPATRTFQAVRIFINRELEEIAAALPQAVELLKPGGRLVVISFHSLEDRMVKQFMRKESAGEQAPPDIPVLAADLRPGRLRLVGKALKPGEAECAANPRARSATLRVAARTEGSWSS
ncbi:MAG: 16S rRNA (cytosine(1402)-N(4))-methyltransferase RsmH [Betaproteobacteria bacterium]|nr:16S rRNA (cytosine(1402)-N(4))-methyltransferase RsmH [Betaproteobacteria bacterium]